MAKNALIKEANLTEELDDTLVAELIRCAGDPIYFMRNYVFVQHPTLGSIPFELRPYQKRIINTIENDHQVVVTAVRQSGKTSTIVGYFLWMTIFQPDISVGVAAHKGSGAKEIITRFKYSYEHLPMWMKPGVITYNVFDVSFDNNSKIISSTTTSDTFRGMSMNCVSSKNTKVTIRNKVTGEISEKYINELLVENERFEVFTSDGFKDFDGVSASTKETIRLVFSDGSSLECTEDHKIFSAECDEWAEAKSLKIGEQVSTRSGSVGLISVESAGIQEVADLVNVRDVNSFYANGINVHNCIYLDELAYVKPLIAQEFWTSIRPALSAGHGMGGRPIKLVCTSTPNGSEGLFADLWFGALTERSTMKAVEVTNQEVPGREDEEAFKREMLQTMSLNKYLQEFRNAFLSDSGTLVTSDVLEALRPTPPTSTYRGMDLFVESLDSRRIAISVDVAEGIGQDNSVIELLDIDTLEQLGEYRDNTSNQTELAKKIVELIEYCFKQEGVEEVYYTVEANPIGLGVLTLLENFKSDVLDRAELVSEYGKKRRGIATTNKNKLSGCGRLKDLLECGKLKIHSKRLISELKFFTKHGSSFRAESGKNDDHVMAIVVMMNMLEELAQIDERVDETIHTLVDTVDEEDWGGGSDPLPFIF